MRAVIMAGGEGSRLRPLTCELPKPMVSIMGKPLCSYSVELLKKHGINDITFTTSQKNAKIKEYFQDGTAFGVCFTYSEEDMPMSTAGGVKKALITTSEDFLVLSGDCLTDINLQKLIEFHKSNSADVTIALKTSVEPHSLSISLSREDSTITEIAEKPQGTEVFSDLVSTGIYVLSPNVLPMIPDNKPSDFIHDILPKLMGEGFKVCGYLFDEYWCEVINIENYFKVHEDMLKGNVAVDMQKSESNGIYLGDNVKISTSARLQGPVYIGNNVVVEEGAFISSSCIFDNGFVGKHANIKRSIVHSNAVIHSNCKLTGAVVMNNVTVGAKSVAFEGCVIGFGTQLAGENKISPKVKIWPCKHIPFGTAVNENIVFGNMPLREFFSNGEILINQPMLVTPRELSLFLTALSQYLGNGKVAIGGIQEIFQETFTIEMAAILSHLGVKVLNCKTQTLGVFKKCLSMTGVDMAIYVGRDKIRLMDSLGNRISPQVQQKIKNEMEVTGSKCLEVQPIKELSGIEEAYIAELNGIIKNCKAKIALFQSGTAYDQLFLSAVSDTNVDVSTYVVESRELAEQIVRKQGYDFGVCFADETMEIVTPDNSYSEGLLPLAYWYIINVAKPEEIKIPPLLYDIFSSSRFHMTECSESEIHFENALNRLFSDGVYLLCRLLECEKPMSSIVASIEVRYKKTKILSCDTAQIGKVLNQFIYYNENAKRLDGITYRVLNSTVVLKPGMSEIRLFTQSASAEVANELCEQVSAQLQSIIKNERSL